MVDRNQNETGIDWGAIGDELEEVGRSIYNEGKEAIEEAEGGWADITDDPAGASADYIKSAAASAVTDAENIVTEAGDGFKEALESAQATAIQDAIAIGKKLALAWPDLLADSNLTVVTDAITDASKTPVAPAQAVTDAMSKLMGITGIADELEAFEAGSFLIAMAFDASMIFGVEGGLGFAINYGPGVDPCTVGVFSGGADFGPQAGVDAKLQLGIWKPHTDQLEGVYLSVEVVGVAGPIGYGVQAVFSYDLETAISLAGIVVAPALGAAAGASVGAGYTFTFPDGSVDGALDAVCFYSDYKKKGSSKKSPRFYIFRGPQYLRQEWNSTSPDMGVKPKYPRSIKSYWRGWPEAWGDGAVDAVVYDPDFPDGAQMILFKGDQWAHHTWHTRDETVYPISDETNGWTGWPESWGKGDVDAVMYNSSEKLFYLFKDKEYVFHEYGKKPTVGPFPIATIGNVKGWPGWPPQWEAGNVDAVVNYPDYDDGKDPKVYLFRRNYYSRSSWGEGPDSGYPRLIPEHWAGWPKAPA